LRSILFANPLDDQDVLIAELWEHGTLGIIEEESGLRAFFEDDHDLSDLLRNGRSAAVEACASQPCDCTREDWEPILIGERFFVAPSWVDTPTPPGRFRLTTDSNIVFGTGRHESTQLMIQALEQHLHSGDTVVDVGCGSGILAIAAQTLGASRIFTCDIESDAHPMFIGSADAIHDATADLTLANISARVIDTLAFDLNRITKPGGLVLLAGFIEENPPQAFKPERALHMNEWLCWICRPQTLNEAGEARLRVLSLSRQWW
jgi:ribosomal protein L11 methylase PrmA